MYHHNSYALIDLDAIRHNIASVAEKTGVPVMAVLKANAYGHGAVPIAHALTDLCTHFAVASVSEAFELHCNGVETPIVILGHTDPADFYWMIPFGIRPTIYNFQDALAFNRTAQVLGIGGYIHLAVDTGMGRIGFGCTEEDAECICRIADMSHLQVEGIFSHYATADCEDLTAARAQSTKFDNFLRLLQARGLQIPLAHLSNSAGAINFSNHYDMVRSGIVTYGVLPSSDVDASVLDLRPALSWHTQIVHLKTAPAGTPISYGGTHVTSRTSRVATIPVGYADGYPRSLSDKFYVLICGKKAPILGRICMDQLMVDVTDIADAELGSAVTLLGSDGKETITVMEMADSADVFHYELLTGLGRRVERRFVRSGHKTQYEHL